MLQKWKAAPQLLLYVQRLRMNMHLWSRCTEADGFPAFYSFLNESSLLSHARLCLTVYICIGDPQTKATMIKGLTSKSFRRQMQPFHTSSHHLSAAMKMPLAACALRSGGQEERKMSSSFIMERMLAAVTSARERSRARLRDGTESVEVSQLNISAIM